MENKKILVRKKMGIKNEAEKEVEKHVYGRRCVEYLTDKQTFSFCPFFFACRAFCLCLLLFLLFFALRISLFLSAVVRVCICIHVCEMYICTYIKCSLVCVFVDDEERKRENERKRKKDGVIG